MKENTTNQSSNTPTKGIELPKYYRVIITVIASIISALIISIYFYLIFCNPTYLDPDKFGLSTLLIFSFTLLLIVNLPWGKLGLRIKKIGIIELEEKVDGQAKDVSKDIADLQVKIDELEKKLGIPETETERELEKLLVNFLGQYNNWAFSPVRIKDWGSSQSGYGSFKNYNLDEIKAELRRLLAKDIVSTRISQKGSTLFIYNK